MQRKENNFNQRKIAKFILKKGETSKQEIASELGLSMPTVLQNVKELVQNGLVIETGKYESTGGRKAAVLSIAEQFRTAVGIDITANHISYVLMDLCGKVIAKKRMKSVFANDSAYYQSVADNLETFLRDIDADRKKILGVGFSLPGIINKHDNVLVRSHVLKQNYFYLKPFSPQKIHKDITDMIGSYINSHSCSELFCNRQNGCLSSAGGLIFSSFYYQSVLNKFFYVLQNCRHTEAQFRCNFLFGGFTFFQDKFCNFSLVKIVFLSLHMITSALFSMVL